MTKARGQQVNADVRREIAISECLAIVVVVVRIIKAAVGYGGCTTVTGLRGWGFGVRSSTCTLEVRNNNKTSSA